MRFEGARFEGERLVVAVAGGFDEHPGEAPRYFACAREHPESDDALACFEEAVADLPPPESWAFELLFERADGRLRVAERSPTSATQSAAP